MSQPDHPFTHCVDTLAYNFCSLLIHGPSHIFECIYVLGRLVYYLRDFDSQTNYLISGLKD